MIFAKFVWKLHSHCCRVVIRSATIEEIEAEKSAIEKDVVRAFFGYRLVDMPPNVMIMFLSFVQINSEIKNGEDD